MNKPPQVRKLRTANDKGNAPASILQSLHDQAKKNLAATQKVEERKRAQRSINAKG